MTTKSRPVSSLRKVPTERSTPQFATRLKEYLAKLGWNASQLVAAAKISRARVDACLGKQNRPLDKADVNAVAVALAVGFDNKWQERGIGKERLGSAYIDSMLNELLELAGFPAIQGYRNLLSDDYWDVDQANSGKQRPLRIGYFPWGDFANDGLKDGLSGAICDQIRVRLGIKELHAVKLEIHELGNALYCRRVDLLAPMLRLPARMSKMSCSDPIPHLSVGINGVIRMEDADSATNTPGNTISFKNVDWNCVCIHYVEGGVPDSLNDIIIPRGQLNITMTSRAHPNFQSACAAVLDSETSGRVNCLIADEITCLHVERLHRGSVQLLSKNQDGAEWEHERLVFPIVLGVHPTEQRFLQRINVCISDMEANGFFRYHLLDKRSRLDYAQIIHENSWLSRDAHFHALHKKLDSIPKVRI